jgi:hypothetical protein
MAGFKGNPLELKVNTALKWPKFPNLFLIFQQSLFLAGLPIREVQIRDFNYLRVKIF